MKFVMLRNSVGFVYFLLGAQRKGMVIIMIHYLISNNGTFFKANLHAHSTVSDGRLTPAQLKELYKAQGYSVLAFTDHELLVDHSDLDDDEFLTITSMEYAFIEKDDYFQSRTIELNLFAKDQHNTAQICYDPSFEKKYTIECIQKVIDEANANGFLVSLNHPSYSMESPEFFGQLDGLFAMEIYNHISFVAGGVFDYNPAMYENMLRRGKSLYCIAADDCHSDSPDSAVNCDRYGGFVMIKAKRLEYGEIISALERGDFYASQGPIIDELYVNDKKVYIKCSPAKYIAMNTEHRPFGGIQIAKDGDYLTEAVFDLPDGQSYMRFDIIDERGRHANTRAYALDEIKDY